MSAERAYIGLGSNLDQPVQQIKRALIALAGIPATRLIATSRLYGNPPMGPQDQPDYINAVACIETELGPHALLEVLQTIEDQQARVRSARRWGPRTIDLDLLLFGDEIIDDVKLTVPHPDISQRTFVLVPLCEIAPDLAIPGLARAGALLAALDSSGVVAINA